MGFLRSDLTSHSGVSHGLSYPEKKIKNLYFTLYISLAIEKEKI